MGEGMFTANTDLRRESRRGWVPERLGHVRPGNSLRVYLQEDRTHNYRLHSRSEVILVVFITFLLYVI
jgi:hypothetical protein